MYPANLVLSSQEESALILLLLFGLGSLLLGVAIYVVTALFLQRLLKNAGHRNAVAAWVPVWNTVALMEIGGIRAPWIWAAIFIGGTTLVSFIPLIGVLLALAILVASIIVQVYLARGVQAAIGTGGVGGIVLSIFVPLAWIIWMALVSTGRGYDRERAIAEGGAMPLNWFGNTDPYAPFGATDPRAFSAPAGYAPPTSAPADTAESETVESHRDSTSGN